VKKRELYITNGISLLLLTVILLYYEVPQKIVFHIFIENGSGKTYTHNELRNGLFSVYKSRIDYDIVMLGDSITEGVEWNELLGLCGIANRGIGGDTTQNILERLPSVYQLHPAKCFVMAGINDILQNIPYETTIDNYERIIRDIQRHNIEAIFQSILYVEEYGRHSKRINQRVEELNRWLRNHCDNNRVEYIDVNYELVNMAHGGGGGGGVYP
jgi:lysophospholipase L1-like esterase